MDFLFNRVHEFYTEKGIESVELKTKLLPYMFRSRDYELASFQNHWPQSKLESVTSESQFQDLLSDIVAHYDGAQSMQAIRDRYYQLFTKTYPKPYEQLEAYLLKLKDYYCKSKNLASIEDLTPEAVEVAKSFSMKLYKLDKRLEDLVFPSQVGLVNTGSISRLIEYLNSNYSGLNFRERNSVLYDPERAQRRNIEEVLAITNRGNLSSDDNKIQEVDEGSDSDPVVKNRQRQRTRFQKKSPTKYKRFSKKISGEDYQRNRLYARMLSELYQKKKKTGTSIHEAENLNTKFQKDRRTKAAGVIMSPSMSGNFGNKITSKRERKKS